MKRQEQQLTLPGVELASLELWKLANGVYTGEIKGLVGTRKTTHGRPGLITKAL